MRLGHQTRRSYASHPGRLGFWCPMTAKFRLPKSPSHYQPPLFHDVGRGDSGVVEEDERQGLAGEPGSGSVADFTGHVRLGVAGPESDILMSFITGACCLD